MSEPNPPSDAPVENATSAAVETEGSAGAGAAATTDNGGVKENNSQDVTMAGLEGLGVKAANAKAGAGAGAETALASSNNAPTTTASSSTNPPTPNRTSTPTGSKESVPARLDNNSSRAASAAPADRTADRVTMPTEPAAHGAPTRQYLNSKVTYHVMEGMKIVAKDQPADPLRVLGDFLLQRSAELERAAAASTGADGDKEKLKENGADASIVEQ